MIENNVFNRSSVDITTRELSAGIYNLAIGLTLLWGFVVNAYLVNTVPAAVIQAWNPFLFFGGYFASCLLGVFLFSRSSVPLVSFIGYNLVVVPFGLVLSVVVDRFEPGLVQTAINTTAGVTLLMMVLATIFTRFFARLGPALFIALICAIVIELVMVFVFKVHLELMDWAVAVIFCGYIGYDWYRANNIPRTLDNAIDSAAALYMDIINLFIRILSILGRR